VSHNQRVERDAKKRGGLIGQVFGRAPHPNRYDLKGGESEATSS
jgi:hypothetical protein